jgi:hypothetical protein
MNSNTRSMVADTRASRRNGSYNRSQKAISHRDSNSRRKQGSRKEYVKDRRIYTVKVSTRGGTAIYKAWEHSDDKMNHHFREADNSGTRFFSFTDVRGKVLKNVDLYSGWRYKMTLRWNPKKESAEGKQGDWQDIREWYSERDNKSTEHRKGGGNIRDGEGNREILQSSDVPAKSLNAGEIGDLEVFPHLKLVVNTPFSDEENQKDGWSDDDEGEGEELSIPPNDLLNTSAIFALEEEKASLIAMLEDTE